MTVDTSRNGERPSRLVEEGSRGSRGWLQKTRQAHVPGAYDGNDALSNSAQSTRRVDALARERRVARQTRARPSRPAGLVRPCD